MKHLVKLGGVVGIIHALEDILLMSLGRWLPVPLWMLYVIGVVLSTCVLTVLIQKLTVKMR